MFQHAAARRRLGTMQMSSNSVKVSTRSRPKAAGLRKGNTMNNQEFQHAAARRRLTSIRRGCCVISRFQHAAARRRLFLRHLADCLQYSFNTQPPEGGCGNSVTANREYKVSTRSRPKAAAPIRASARLSLSFQHAAARRRLSRNGSIKDRIDCFNTQPPEGG